jgi:serine phosphatase RsbU (regulator of sigma subunit)
LIGNMIMDKILEKQGVRNPADILNMLDKEVYHVLKQGQEKNEAGMDVAMCMIEQTIENQEFKITFAGAHRPLYYYLQGSSELLEMKGDRKSIGVYNQKQPDFSYTNKEIVMQRNDCLYLFSDGFADQDNVLGKKIGTAPMRQMIFKNINFPMEEQGNNIEDFLTKHMEGTEQRDDIMLLGIKL